MVKTELLILFSLTLCSAMYQYSVTWPVAWQWTETLKPCVYMCMCVFVSECMTSDVYNTCVH